MLTRSELIEMLAKRFPQLTALDADASVRVLLEGMADALIKGNRIEIRGFGSFGLNYRPPRIGRNPKTGVKVEVPAKYTPHFKPGKDMRERVEATAKAEAEARSQAASKPLNKEQISETTAWLERVNKNMRRMSQDEEYRKEIAKKVS